MSREKSLDQLGVEICLGIALVFAFGLTIFAGKNWYLAHEQFELFHESAGCHSGTWRVDNPGGCSFENDTIARKWTQTGFGKHSYILVLEITPHVIDTANVDEDFFDDATINSTVVVERWRSKIVDVSSSSSHSLTSNNPERIEQAKAESFAVILIASLGLSFLSFVLPRLIFSKRTHSNKPIQNSC